MLTAIVAAPTNKGLFVCKPIAAIIMAILHAHKNSYSATEPEGHGWMDGGMDEHFIYIHCLVCLYAFRLTHVRM